MRQIYQVYPQRGPHILLVNRTACSLPRMSNIIFQRKSTLPVHPSSDSISVSPDSQDVPSYNLASVELADTLLQHLSHKIGKFRHVLEALWCTLNAIEVGADTYVIVANHVSNVLDMLHHLLQGRGLGDEFGQTRGAVRSTTADKVWVRIYHHNTTCSLDVGKYMVGNIARMRADRIGARVTEDGWCNAALPAIFTMTEDVSHGVLAYMTEINEHT